MIGYVMTLLHLPLTLEPLLLVAIRQLDITPELVRTYITLCQEFSHLQSIRFDLSSL
jgi:hypothetical protein